MTIFMFLSCRQSRSNKYRKVCVRLFVMIRTRSSVLMICNFTNSVISFGASGSFGHFQASKSGVHKGQLHKPLVKGGFVATRISVRSHHLSFFFLFQKDHSICSNGACEDKNDSLTVILVVHNCCCVISNCFPKLKI